MFDRGCGRFKVKRLVYKYDFNLNKRILVEVDWKYFVSSQKFPHNTKFLKTNQKARCNICNFVIPKDTLKLQIVEDTQYGSRRRYINKKSVCLSCAKPYLRLLTKEAKKLTAFYEGLGKEVSRKDRMESKKKIKEYMFIEQI